MDYPLLIVLTLAGAVFLAFLRPGGAPERVALLGVASLFALGILGGEDLALIAGNSAPLIIGCMFVIGESLRRTGCLTAAGVLLGRLAGGTERGALMAVMLTAMGASAVMSNTPVVIVMTPLAIALARSLATPTARLLIPLSYAAIFGGMTTLIGTSTNLLVSGAAEQRGLAPVGMFEMTAPALILAAAGMLYMATLGRILLPKQSPPAPRSLSAAAVAEPPGWSDDAPGGRSARAAKAPIAVAIVLLLAMLAALGAAPLVWLAAAGAAATVLTGCVRPGEAARAVDWRILGLILGMIGLSLALRKTGAEAALAEALASLGAGFPPVLTLLLIYLATSLLTELISNNAVALLAAPVAILVAEQMGVAARPFLMAVMIAASASFATPIGYQTNTLVYGASGCRFGDFLRVGLPLNLLCAGLSTLLLPLFFPF